MRPAAERITSAETIGRMVLSAQERGGETALRYPSSGGERSVTYAELGEGSRELARGLIALGLQVGDVVALLCSTSAQWTMCEMGVMCAGGVLAPIYDTNSPQECRHVLADSGARLVICQDAAQAAKIEQFRDELPALAHAVVIEGTAPGAITLGAVRDRAGETDADLVEDRVAAVSPQDVATLVYTSGTTGLPKGCMLTHANFLAATAMFRGQLELDDVRPVIYMFLPLAHVLARIVFLGSERCAGPSSRCLLGSRAQEVFDS